MIFVDRDRGPIELEVASDEAASLIGRHHAGIRARLSGDPDAFAGIEGQHLRVGPEIHVPETDPDVLVDLYFSGELDYSDPYDVDFLGGGGVG